MEEELAGVRRALEVGGNIPAATALHMVGIGRDAIERSLKGLLPALRQARDGDESPSGLLLLGFAGAVDPSLSTGDLVLAGRYCHLRELPVPLVRVPDGMTLEEFERREMAELMARDPNLPQRAVLKLLDPDPGMWRHAKASLAQGGLTAIETDSLTTPELVTSPDTKRELHRRYQVGTVNMEDYWVARQAAAVRVPFLSVRAVLDTAGQRLPSFLMELPGRPGWAALHTLVQPRQVPILFRLMRQMPSAQERLAQFALAFIDYQQKAAPGGAGAA
jgi:hypothetical protein